MRSAILLSIFMAAAGWASAQQSPAPGPASGSEPTREVVGDWAVLCQEIDSVRHCLLGQDIYCKEDAGQARSCLLPGDERGPTAFQIGVITVLDLVDSEAAAAGIEVYTPLGTDLSRNICIHFDNNLAEGKCYPFQVCRANGCLARLAFTERQVELAKRGNVMNARIYSLDTVPPSVIDMKISLAGFTKAFGLISQ